ncbi:MAG: hypothetical protein V1735_07345 [Nanoarchaeota archaeon]
MARMNVYEGVMPYGHHRDFLVDAEADIALARASQLAKRLLPNETRGRKTLEGVLAHCFGFVQASVLAEKSPRTIKEHIKEERYQRDRARRRMHALVSRAAKTAARDLPPDFAQVETRRSDYFHLADQTPLLVMHNALTGDDLRPEEFANRLVAGGSIREVLGDDHSFELLQLLPLAMLFTPGRRKLRDRLVDYGVNPSKRRVILSAVCGYHGQEEKRNRLARGLVMVGNDETVGRMMPSWAYKRPDLCALTHVLLLTTGEGIQPSPGNLTPLFKLKYSLCQNYLTGAHGMPREMMVAMASLAGAQTADSVTGWGLFNSKTKLFHPPQYLDDAVLGKFFGSIVLGHCNRLPIQNTPDQYRVSLVRRQLDDYVRVFEQFGRLENPPNVIHDTSLAEEIATSPEEERRFIERGKYVSDSVMVPRQLAAVLEMVEAQLPELGSRAGFCRPALSAWLEERGFEKGHGRIIAYCDATPRAHFPYSQEEVVRQLSQTAGLDIIPSGYDLGRKARPFIIRNPEAVGYRPRSQ